MQERIQVGHQGVIGLRCYPPEDDVADIVEGNEGDVVMRMQDALVARVKHCSLQVENLTRALAASPGPARPAASASVFEFWIGSPAGPLMHLVESCSAISRYTRNVS